jgi:hypothetical protein
VIASTIEGPCPHCIEAQGLCRSCERGILPLLAVNLGWLRLMGESLVEQRARQTKRQSKPRPRDAAAIAKAIRRETRKRARSGLRGLITHVLTAA